MKIPLLLAQEPVAAARAPRAVGDLTGQGEASLGQGLLQLGVAFGDIEKAQAAKRQLAARTEIALRKSEFDVAVATLDADLRLTHADPDAYLAAHSSGVGEAQRTILAKTQSPEAAQALQLDLARAVGLRQIEAQKHYNTLFISRAEGQLATTLDNQKRLLGVAGTDEDKAALYRAGLDAVNALEPLRGSKATAEKRIAWRNDFLMDIERRKQDADPETWTRRAIQGVLPDDQIQRLEERGERLSRQAEVARQRTQQEFERGMKAQGEEAERRMGDVIRDPSLTAAQKMARLNDFREFPLLSAEKIDHFERLIASGFAARPSDAQAKIGVDRLLYRAEPAITDAELDRLATEHAAGRPGLNPGDYATAKQYLAGVRRHERDTGEGQAQTYQGRAQAQAEQRVRESIGMTSPLDQLIPENKTLLDQAMEQLTQRSVYFKDSKGGAEDPLRVADEIIPILRQARLMDLGVGKSSLTRWAAALQAAKDAGEVSEATYRSQRTQIERRMKELERREQLVPPTPPTGPKPTPSLFQKQTGR